MSDVLNVAGHPIDLDDGRMLAPGEEATEVNTDHPHNRALVVNGHLSVLDGMTPRKTQPDRLVSEAAKAATAAGQVADNSTTGKD